MLRSSFIFYDIYIQGPQRILFQDNSSSPASKSDFVSTHLLPLWIRGSLTCLPQFPWFFMPQLYRLAWLPSTHLSSSSITAIVPPTPGIDLILGEEGLFGENLEPKIPVFKSPTLKPLWVGFRPYFHLWGAACRTHAAGLLSTNILLSGLWLISHSTPAWGHHWFSTGRPWKLSLWPTSSRSLGHTPSGTLLHLSPSWAPMWTFRFCLDSS